MCLRCWRRILNTSRRLDWNTYTAPALQNYMERMMAARYNKNYRLGILKSALVIYYNKVEKDRDGTTLTNRPKLPSAPIIVPSNPNDIHSLSHTLCLGFYHLTGPLNLLFNHIAVSMFLTNPDTEITNSLHYEFYFSKID